MNKQEKKILMVTAVIAILTVIVFRKNIFGATKKEIEQPKKEENKGVEIIKKATETYPKNSVPVSINAIASTNAPLYIDANNRVPVLTVVPRGSKIQILSDNSQWFYKASYNEGGRQLVGYVEKYLIQKV
jgi:L-cystine uptake protein TcyP (sodium:dicarboxylate symporter family)